ncbi:MAG: DJ-1/PfpI family protein [Candidatus Firestonebacteria bacterium]|nr:DJ-1/PfpI family protein [Candidatus Firestonebacteria bacterium]
MPILQNKKVLFIIANNNFRDEELFFPREILQNAGAEIFISSSVLTPASGLKGSKIDIDLTIDTVVPNKFDAVIFVGGGAREYFSNRIAHKIAQDTIKAGKILGAICIAPVILANSGVLKNKRATVFKSEIETIKKLNIIYDENKVVEDGNIITASGPEAAKEFGEAIKNKLSFLS